MFLIMGDFWKIFFWSFLKKQNKKTQKCVAKTNKQKVKVILKCLILIHNKHSTSDAQLWRIIKKQSLVV